MSDSGRKKKKYEKKGDKAKEILRKTHIEEAVGHFKAADPLHALQSFNLALDLNPEDKNALVARSKCYLQLGEAKKALDDAEAALSIDGSFIKALYQKAEALYYLGDFEHSLMYFHRGLRLRPDMEGFRLGVQKAQEAIENIIGSRTTGTLATPEQLTAMLNGMRTVDELYKAAVLDLGKEPLPPLASGQSSAGANSKSAKCGTNGKPVLKSIGKKKAEKQLLGDLYVDKVYLEDLLTNKLDIISLNQDFANNDVAAHAKEGIEFLTTRQDFWRQQKPKNAGPMKIKKREVIKQKT